ncbi:hypothetical protein MRB53_041934 [Persea americana]|nr:hypothetical protein MRB53_041934 [Persea americana]
MVMIEIDCCEKYADRDDPSVLNVEHAGVTRMPLASCHGLWPFVLPRPMEWRRPPTIAPSEIEIVLEWNPATRRPLKQLSIITAESSASSLVRTQQFPPAISPSVAPARPRYIRARTP